MIIDIIAMITAHGAMAATVARMMRVATKLLIAGGEIEIRIEIAIGGMFPVGMTIVRVPAIRGVLTRATTLSDGLNVVV